MKQRRDDIRRWSLWSGKLLLAALLIALLARSLQSQAIISVIVRANPLLIAAALLLLPVNLFFQFRKWRLLVRSRFPFVSRRDLTTSLLLGFTFGIVTPARIGEFGGRAAGIRRKGRPAGGPVVGVPPPGMPAEGMPADEKLSAGDRLTLVGLTGLDKLATMLITLSAGLGGLLYFGWRHPFMDPVLLTGIIATVAVAAPVIIRRQWHAVQRATRDGSTDGDDSTHRDTAAAGKFGFLRKPMAEAGKLLRTLDRQRLRSLLILSSLFYATFLLQFFFLLLAFGPIDALSAIAGICTIMLVKTVIPPVTVGELGIREGASVYVLGHAGIAAAAAFNASLLLFAINVVLPSIAGLALLFTAGASARLVPPVTKTTSGGRP